MNNIKDIVFLKTFGKNLKEYRLNKGFSQEELAYAADIPISQVGRIERGEINTTISTVFAISKALEIDLDELFFFNKKKSV